MVERELRVALLRRKARTQWLGAAWRGAGITFFFLVILGLTANPSKGRALFYCLFAMAWIGVVTRGFGLTADLFSEERRSGTLGLLVLTGLTPLEIFVNKLSGALLLTSYGLLGAVPFFAIPFLAGGITALQFLCALVFLANALVFCVAIGLLASVIHREGGQAQATGITLAAGLCVAAPAVLWLGSTLFGMSPFHQAWLVTSPAYAGYLVFANLAGGSSGLFWNCSGITLCYSLVALLAAAAILQRTWRDTAESAIVPEAWRSRLNWSLSQEQRGRLRERLLRQNPFSWLVARERGPVRAAYAWLALGALVWLGLWLAGGKSRASAGNALVASFVMHLGLNWIVTYAAAKRLGEERQSGGFEVLLTTPVTVREIVEGQSKGLIAQFKRPWFIALLLNISFAVIAIRGRWSVSLAAGYFSLWLGFLLLCTSFAFDSASRAMWISTWTGRPGYAAMHAMRPQFWLVFSIFFVGRLMFGGTRKDETAALILGGFFLFNGIVATFSRRRTLREKLTKELRDIACAAIPARGDKRFKNWNPQQIYPPGRWGYFDLSWPGPRYVKLQPSKSKIQKSIREQASRPRTGV
jgi:ABC-type transport system involved in cytochrome c biogenesis permease component